MVDEVVRELAAKIRDVPDFPRKGILFKDITTLLKDPQAFRTAIDRMTAPFRDQPVDVVAGIESRGFIFAAPMAYQLGAAFVPIRKAGRLPAETLRVEYELEYGTSVLEIHRDAITPGQRVLLVDDLLATAGTVRAAIDLIERLGGQLLGLCFLIELTFLRGRERLSEYPLVSIIQY